MIVFRDKNWEIRDYVLLSWIGPGLLAIIASLMVFILLGWLDYQNNNARIIADLERKSRVAARRISAEILLGEHGSLVPVIELLNQELAIKNIHIENDSSVCGSPASETCSHRSGEDMIFFRKTPHIDTVSYVVITHPMRSFWSSLNLYLLLWSALPVFLTLVTGLILQRLFLRRFVIDPINSLVPAAERQASIPDHWPLEIKAIARNLAESFEAREQSVFAMLAKGVVHDIKTFLHTLLIATELVREQQADPEKRAVRLESLFRSCSMNLPKIKRIIELTLDGSREIPIRAINAALAPTICGAIEANLDHAKANSVKISVFLPDGEITVAHDPVQLERALSNLIKNGIEALPSGDSSSKRQVRISVTNEDNGLIKTSVEDTGLGIDCESTNLFKPTRSKKAHGAGLGLYVTEKIVRGHGGYIRVTRSEDLGGANFYFYLPKFSLVDGRQA